MNKKNLLYIAFLREDSEAKGFIKKVNSQCKAFNNLGFNSYLYISNSKESILYKINETDKQIIKRFKYSSRAVYDKNQCKFKRKKSSFFRFKEFIKNIKSEIYTMNFDKIYIRRIKPITPTFINFLKECTKRHAKVYFEFPDYPDYTPRPRELLKYIDYSYDKLGLLQVKRFSTKFVAISVNQCVDSDDILYIKNGIDLEQTPLRQKKVEVNNKEIHLVGVANVGFWHAYDRVIEGMYDYYKINPDIKVFFNIVGDGSAITSLKELSLNLNLSDYIIFHGTKEGEELNGIIDQSDIGIGILGNHRKNLFGDSSLKNREYCARGIPFIIAADDYDFGVDFNFKLRIPADDSNLQISEVIKFFNLIRNNYENYPIEMREYAKNNLTWESKLKKVADD